MNVNSISRKTFLQKYDRWRHKTTHTTTSAWPVIMYEASRCYWWQLPVQEGSSWNRSRFRHCTGRCTIYYSATMLVPLVSDAKDRNQRSAWSRPSLPARPASCQRDKPNLLEPASEPATTAHITNDITTLCLNKNWCWILAITVQMLTNFNNCVIAVNKIRFPIKFVQNIYITPSTICYNMLWNANCWKWHKLCCNISFRHVANVQQTLLQFLHIVNTWMVDTLLGNAADRVMTRPRWGLFHLMILTTLHCCLLQKPDSGTGCVWEHNADERWTLHASNEWHMHLWNLCAG